MPFCTWDNGNMGDVAAPVPSTVKGPHPWLGPILTIVAIGVTVIWAYLQMRHWKDPDADYVAIAANIVITLVLWAVLVSAIVATYRFKKATPPEKRPIVKPTIVVGLILLATLGLDGAWFLSNHYRAVPIAKKASP